MSIRRAIILMAALFVSSGFSAPIATTEKLFDVQIQEVPEGLINVANKKVSNLQESVAVKANAINGLVDTASNTVSSGYSAVTDTFNMGLNTVSQMLSNGVNVASSNLAPSIESVGRGFNFVSSGVNTGLASLGDTISQQYTQVGSTVADRLRIAGDLAMQGTSLVQSTMAQIGDTVSSFINRKSDTVSGAADQARSILPKENPFEERPRKIESAILEEEDILSKTSSVKDNLQQFVAGIFQPEPVVDNIKNEEEKYGNTGDKFAVVGKALVGTTEGIASFLSNAVNAPFQIVKTISKTVTEKFNNLGGRLIGL